MNLRCYDAGKDKPFLEEWNRILPTLNEHTALDDLRREVDDNFGKPGTCMKAYFIRASQHTQPFAGLSQAESTALRMYSEDTNPRAFFAEYNKACSSQNFWPL